MRHNCIYQQSVEYGWALVGGQDSQIAYINQTSVFRTGKGTNMRQLLNQVLSARGAETRNSVTVMALAMVLSQSF